MLGSHLNEPTRRALLRSGAAAGLTFAASAGGPAFAQETGAAAFDEAAEFSAQSGGTAVLVYRGGIRIYERYDNGGAANLKSTIASGTKSFWGPVACMMIADGLIDGFDEPAQRTLPEWRDDPRKSRITLRQILSLSSGLDNDLPALQGMGTASDKFRHSLVTNAVDEPGERYTYGPVNYYVFGEIVRRKLKGRYRDPLAYLDERVLKPLGIVDYDWVRDPSGNPHMPNGASLTARDWALFGQFLLQEGRWKGRQLAPAALMRELRQPSAANPGYGMTLWLNRPAQTTAQAAGAGRGQFYPDGLPDLFAAVGAGPNMLYMVPDKQLLVVRRRPHQERDANTPVEQLSGVFARQTGNFRHRLFLTRILAGLDQYAG